MTSAPAVLVVSDAGAGGALEVAACAAVAAGREETLLLDLRRSPRRPRAALLASAGARRLEARIAERAPGLLLLAARGHLCFAVSVPEDGADPLGAAEATRTAIASGIEADLAVVVVDATDFRATLAGCATARPAAVLRAEPASDRALLGLLARELRAESVPFRIWKRRPGRIAAARALSGLDPGGESGRCGMWIARTLLGSGSTARSSRATGGRLAAEGGQALPAVLALAVVIVALALALVALGGAATAKGRLQRASDLAALSAARSMRDDFTRLFAPALLPGGAPNPAHLERSEYLERARSVAVEAATRNGAGPYDVDVGFPDAGSMAPTRVEVEVSGTIAVGGERADGAETSAAATAAITPPSAPTGLPATASGGGYSGPLAYRQGEGMRPDVAAAFDRMASAASRAGVSLIINSAYRSDAEQARLFAANPDPRWVAPPGQSLHRCATELDLGPPSATGWLAANAERFGFVQRYSWEAWHYGYDAGPEPCSAAGDEVGESDGDGRSAGEAGLPGFVPAGYRDPILRAAAGNDVSAALLAAQLMTESNFNPNAVSPAGAEGIAQFMPGTAAAYGLDDPFDPEQAIAAQGRLMGELMAQFGSVELALAAYNAGPGAVAACGCIPPYPETEAYVARIMALLDGAGALAAPAPTLEVRLVG